MPKTYRVAETDYEFPDDFTDDKVQSILTQQGIIKLPSAKNSTPKLKGNPSGLPDTFMGTIAKRLAAPAEFIGRMATNGPFQMVSDAYQAVAHPIDTISSMASGAAQIPADLLADIKNGKYGKLSADALLLLLPGIGSSRARELAAGAAESADAAMARAATRINSSQVPEAIGKEISAGGITPDLVSRIRARLNPAPESPAPFRPNPAVARRMPSAPPFEDPSLSRSAGSMIPRRGLAPQAPAPAPQAPQPFRPSAITARRMPSAPVFEDPSLSRSPGRVIPRGKGPEPVLEVPQEIIPQAPEPFRANPRTANKMRFTPAGDTSGMPSSSGRNIPRRGVNRAMEPPAAEGDEATAEAPQPSPKSKLTPPEPAVASPDAAAKLTYYARQASLTPDQVDLIGLKDWQGIGKKYNLSGITQETIDQVKKNLGARFRPKVSRR